MSAATFVRTLADHVESQGLFEPDARIVVAVSGGCDSMALLQGLLALNQEAGYSLSLHVAHLNHQLRDDESDADAAFVQAAADDLGLPCTIEKLDPQLLESADAGSLEEAARRNRYDFFARVCRRSGGIERVAVGHQADDNAETVLHRIVRGTGWRGVSGIPPCRPLSEGSAIIVVRPLLRFTRCRLEAFLASRGVPYREDRTNATNEPTRNRIRNVVMPLLREEVNPQVSEALLRLAEQARWLQEYLHETVDKVFDTLLISRTDQELALNATSLANKSPFLRAELIRRAIQRFQLGEQSVSFAHAVAVADLLGDKPSGRQVHLPGGMTVTRSYDRLIFSLPTDEPREELAPEVAVRVPGTTTLPRRRLRIECDVLTPPCERIQRRRGAHDAHEEWADYGKLHLPLVVRSRRPGDRFWPLGAPGAKKLSDFLIDAKVEPGKRESLAVLCDQLGPIWLIGHRIDERIKLTAGTRKVLHMRATPLGGDA